MSCYLVQEVDGVGRFALEDGSGFLLLENCVPVPPSGNLPMGGPPVPHSRRRRIEDTLGDAEMLAVILSEL